MNKAMTKLIASLLSLIVAAALVVTSSYAWMVLSAEPEIRGIEIQIGGSNTILLAPDTVVTNEDGTVSHYPGAFSQKLNFSDYEVYEYIQNLVPLAPVSTADGVHWILADYYSATDPLVQQGLAAVGQLRDYQQLPQDTGLQYANLTAQTQEERKKGCYVYLDFWVVSPADGYDLRVSTGDDSSQTGSFVVNTMVPSPNEDGAGYVLTPSDKTAAASVRIGFLANQDWAPYADTMLYLGSQDYSDQYTHLLGSYQEPGESLSQYSDANNIFTIYEPNGNLHLDGSSHYQITRPLGVTNGKVSPTDVFDRLTVQLASNWKTAPGSEQTLLEQEFAAATFNIQARFDTPEEMSQYFYEQRLQGMLHRYVSKGMFVTNTQELYAQADQSGNVDSDNYVLHTGSGATEDVKITPLLKNVPQRIRMFIWLEGQDADCVNHNDISSLTMSLELAGS